MEICVRCQKEHVMKGSNCEYTCAGASPGKTDAECGQYGQYDCGGDISLSQCPHCFLCIRHHTQGSYVLSALMLPLHLLPNTQELLTLQAVAVAVSNVDLRMQDANTISTTTVVESVDDVGCWKC